MRMSSIESAIAIVLLVLGAGFGWAGSDGSDQSRANWLFYDFEDGNLDGWAIPSGGCTMSADFIGADGSSRSLRVDGACGHYGGTLTDIGGMQVTGLSYWVRSGNSTADDAYVVLTNGDDTNYVLVVLASASGLFVTNNSDEPYFLTPYVADTWYYISIEIDWDGKVFDVAIDNQPVAYNLALNDVGAEGVGRLYAYNLVESTSWWDEIFLSSPPVLPFLMSDGFESADDTGWSLSAPALAQRLVLFSAGGVDGVLAGRLGADWLCGKAALGMDGLPLHSRTQAFLSVDVSDQISDFPTLFQCPIDRTITGPGTEVIADDWADLLDGTIDQTLAAAGILGSNDFWYSGTDSAGDVTAQTCDGWTDGSTVGGATYGWASETTIDWINNGSATCGLETYSILCLAWRQD